MATPQEPTTAGEMVPYWVFPPRAARIERPVPVMPFSREAAALPRLRKALAAYRLAFGQPRQEELVEFLGADRSDADLLRLAARLRIDLSPPDSTPAVADRARLAMISLVSGSSLDRDSAVED